MIAKNDTTKDYIRALYKKVIDDYSTCPKELVNIDQIYYESYRLVMKVVVELLGEQYIPAEYTNAKIGSITDRVEHYNLQQSNYTNDFTNYNLFRQAIVTRLKNYLAYAKRCKLKIIAKNINDLLEHKGPGANCLFS